MELYNGDCLEIMKNIPDESIDLILCDLPYGKLKNTEIDGYKNRNTDWDDIIDTQSLYRIYERVLRPKGVAILFSQEPYTSHLRTFKQENFEFLYSMIWLKDHFANALSAKKAPVSYFEDISCFCKKFGRDYYTSLRTYFRRILQFLNISPSDINKKLGHRKAEHCFYVDALQFSIPTKETYQELIDVFHINEMEGFISYDEINKIYSLTEKRTFNLQDNIKFVSNVLDFKKEYSRYHPTQKPVALLERLIKIYSNEGDIILDNCMGSGSTGVACLNTNRKFIGIEKDENYFQIAKERLEEVKLKLEQPNKENSEEQSQIEAFF